MTTPSGILVMAAKRRKKENFRSPQLAGVNQRPKVYLYSGPTSMLIISLPGQPYHIIDFSFIFKQEFSEFIHLFIKNRKGDSKSPSTE
jgi:hypothetical protein